MTSAATLAATATSLTQSPHFDRPTYLMCAPEWYDVDYVINPWMAGNLHRPSRDRAFAQWRSLHEALRRVADVRLLHPRAGSPDMVFVAHAALVQYGIAAVSSFAHPERQAEEQPLRTWFREAGFLVWDTPRQTAFEGEGDALFDDTGRHLWAAHGVRTCHRVHQHVAAAWHVEVKSLHLVDPRFYHLDLCFAPLSDGHLLYFPGAFDSTSLTTIETAYPAAKRVAISEREAIHFGCNVINIGRHIIASSLSPELQGHLHALGFNVNQLDLSEFLRGGGSAKSLALRLSDQGAVFAGDLL